MVILLGFGRTPLLRRGTFIAGISPCVGIVDSDSFATARAVEF